MDKILVAITLLLFLTPGPDITDPGPGRDTTAPAGMSGGSIAGIAIGCLLGLVVIVAVTIYLIHFIKKKQEEKMAKAYSVNSLLPSGNTLSTPSCLQVIQILV